MTFANIFFRFRDDANTIITDYLQHDEEASGEYSGPVTNRAGRLFRFMADQQTVANLFKVVDVAGQDWHLYSLSVSDPAYDAQQVKAEIDWLVSTYSTQSGIVGAWKWTGEQLGTEHEYTTATESVTYSKLNPDYDPSEFLEDGTTPNPSYDPQFVIRVTEDQEVTRITGMTGTPTYPIPYANLLEFMPDVDELPASVLADVNLLFGQAPRSFF